MRLFIAGFIYLILMLIGVLVLFGVISSDRTTFVIVFGGFITMYLLISSRK